MNDSPSTERLLKMARRVCTNRGWQLLSCPEAGVTEIDVVEQMKTVLCDWRSVGNRSEIDDSLIERAAVHVYCRILHRAVGSANTAVQERALIEIWNYITPIVRRYLGAGEDAMECANEALATIWEKHQQVRTPGAFLSWTAMITTRIAMHFVSDKNLPIVNHEDVGEDCVHINSGSIQGLAEEVEERLRLAHLEVLIRRCLASSVAQQEVFIRLVLHEMKASEVASALGITSNYVHGLKRHARIKLSRCSELLQTLGKNLRDTSEVGRCA